MNWKVVIAFILGMIVGAYVWSRPLGIENNNLSLDIVQE